MGLAYTNKIYASLPRHKQLALNLKLARCAKGYTQTQIEMATGLPKNALVKIENGQRGIDALELSCIANFLKVNIDSLLP